MAQAALVGTLLVAYLGLRVVVEGSKASAIDNAEGLLSFEAALGLDVERSAQDLVPVTSALMETFNLFYLWAYWPLLGVALAFVWWRDAAAYSVLRNSLVIAAAVGLVVFALYPVAPPRFFVGFTDTVGDGRDSGLTNKYAAMPSFHVGWLVLTAVTALGVTRGTVARWMLFAPAALMAVVVVVTANHYVLDGVVGVVISLAALGLARRLACRGDRNPMPRDPGRGLASGRDEASEEGPEVDPRRVPDVQAAQAPGREPARRDEAQRPAASPIGEPGRAAENRAAPPTVTS